MLRRGIAGAVAAVTMSLLAAAPAGAWWAELSMYGRGGDGIADIHALPDERNDMTIMTVPGPQTEVYYQTRGMNALVIRDSSAPVTPPPAGHGAGCNAAGDHTVVCTWGVPTAGSNQIGYVRVDLRNRGDRVTIPETSLPLTLAGWTGAGDDVVRSYTPNAASIELGRGDDSIVLRGSRWGFGFEDRIGGGRGNDVLDVVNGETDDNPVCGAGVDTLYADPGEPSVGCETIR